MPPSLKICNLRLHGEKSIYISGACVKLDSRLCPIDSGLELTISNFIAFNCNRAEKFATVTFMAKNQLLFGRLCEVGLPNSYDRFRNNANFLHFFLKLIATEFKNLQPASSWQKIHLYFGRLCEVGLPTLSDRLRTHVNNLHLYCNSLQSR